MVKRTDEERYDLIDCWRSGQIPEERMVELLREDVRLLRLFNQNVDRSCVECIRAVDRCEPNLG